MRAAILALALAQGGATAPTADTAAMIQLRIKIDTLKGHVAALRSSTTPDGTRAAIAELISALQAYQSEREAPPHRAAEVGPVLSAAADLQKRLGRLTVTSADHVPGESYHQRRQRLAQAVQQSSTEVGALAGQAERLLQPAPKGDRQPQVVAAPPDARPGAGTAALPQATRNVDDWLRRMGAHPFDPRSQIAARGFTNDPEQLRAQGVHPWPTRDAVAQPNAPLLAAQPPTAPTAPTAPVAPAAPTLRLGERGAHVVELQKNYNASRQPGQPRIEEDGVLGRNTLRAIRQFQQRRGLEAPRGPRVASDSQTTAALRTAGEQARVDKIVPGDTRQEAVRLLQDQLSRVPGFGAVDRDGVYGRGLEAQIRRFQQQNGLRVTGQVDEETMTKIHAAVAAAPPIGRGDTRRAAIERVQDMLGRVDGMGYVHVDGAYTQRIEDRIKRFQERQGIPVTGVIDAQTRRALEDASRGRERNPMPPQDAPFYSRRLPEAAKQAIRQAAANEGVPPDRLEATCWAEGGVTAGTSSAGARGACQITSSAWAASCRHLGAYRTGVGDPGTNAACAARIYRERLGWAQGNTVIASSLYNTRARNWERILQSGRVPAIDETVAYVVRIARYQCEVSGGDRRAIEELRPLLPVTKLRLAHRANARMADWIQHDMRRPANPSCSVF